MTKSKYIMIEAAISAHLVPLLRFLVFDFAVPFMSDGLGNGAVISLFSLAYKAKCKFPGIQCVRNVVA